VAENNAINEIYYVDVRQSMRNGGGPACLRLAVPLDSEEKKLVNNKNILTENLYNDLKVWINKHYREEISPNDLRDVNLMYESFSALDELTNIMQLGSDFYSFQK
jgi:succinylarginine dihydrolase